MAVVEPREEADLGRGAAGGRSSACRSCACARESRGGASDFVAAEEPLEIRLEGEPVAVTMRTPAPGAGRRAGARIPAGRGDRRRWTTSRASTSAVRATDDGGIADVRLRPGARPADGWQRSFYATSSCGICGKASIEAVRVAAARRCRAGPASSAATLAALPGQLRARQRAFERTGGLHAAGAVRPRPAS